MKKIIKKIFNSSGFMENTLLFLVLGLSSLAIPAITKNFSTNTSTIAQQISQIASDAETCGSKTCSSGQTCVGSSDNDSLGTFCLSKGAGGLSSYCGRPDNGDANNLACASNFCNVNTLKCETPPNCITKTCTSGQTCVGSSDSDSIGTFCLNLNVGGIGSYCGRPNNGGPNSEACASSYCNPSTLKCATTGSPANTQAPAAPGNGSSPVGGTSPLNPPIESNQCLDSAGKVANAQYLEPRCGGQKFDALKATPENNVYCGKSYSDVYTCGGREFSENAAIDACNKSPWCPPKTASNPPANNGTSCASLGGTCLGTVTQNSTACTPSTGGSGRYSIRQGVSGCANPNPFCFVCERTAVTPVPNEENPGVTTAPQPTTRPGTGEACTSENTICGGNNSNSCLKSKDGNTLHCCRFTERFCEATGTCVNGGTPEFENCGKPIKTPSPTPIDYIDRSTCNSEGSPNNHCDALGRNSCCSDHHMSNGIGSSSSCVCVPNPGTIYASAENNQSIASASECSKNSDCRRLGKNACALNSRNEGVCK